MQTRRRSQPRAVTPPKKMTRRSPRSKTAAVILTVTTQTLPTPSQLSLKEPEPHPM